MKYEHPELQHRLAAEYVLGTLQGPARRRFERLLAEDTGLRRKVAAWESRLTPWAAAMAPEAVPPRVWQGIRRRLGFEADAVRPGPWRWLALGSTALAAGLALVLVMRPAPPAPEVPPAPPVWQDLAVLADQQQPVWIVRASADGARLRFSGLADAPLPAGHDYELWVLTPEGTPLSLGVVQASGARAAEVAVGDAGRALMARGVALAISLEPVGGSPTGAPTGPVLWSGKLRG